MSAATHMDTFAYDVFISYASENRGWVEDSILRPLQRCRTPDGSMPRIFFDRDRRMGLEVGESWPDALAEAIGQSRRFVPIYSREYFQKPMCQRELNVAYVTETRRQQMIYPVLMDLSAVEQMPTKMVSLQFIPVDAPDWFGRLCRALELQPSAEVLTLRIATPLPASVLVNNTLPPVRVEVLSDGMGRGRNVEVTLSAKRGELRGELSVWSRDGVAVFEDLSFVAPSQQEVTLSATADGCVSHRSQPFRVTRPAPAAVAAVAPAGRRIEASGDPMFFGAGDHVILDGGDHLRLWSAEGTAIGSGVAQSTPRRVQTRSDDAMAFADWAGRVWSTSKYGETSHWNCATREDGLAVPGGIALSGDTVYAGFWDGAIYQLRAGMPPRLLHHHQQGVQGLAVLGERLVFADLNGRLFLHDANGVSSGVDTGESYIHGMTAAGDSVIMVGDRHLLKFLPASRTLLHEPLRLAAIRGVVSDVGIPIVCDVNGRGFRFDAGLTPRRRFQVPSGARPVSADHAGDWAVCRQDDGASIVLYRHQVVYTHPGPLAVSPNGRVFAVGESGGGLRLLDRPGMEALIERRPDA